MGNIKNGTTEEQKKTKEQAKDKPRTKEQLPCSELNTGNGCGNNE